MFDPKKIAQDILGPSQEEPTLEVSVEDSSNEGLKAAAEDMLQAFQEKSPEGLHKALQAYLDMYEQGEEEPSEE